MKQLILLLSAIFIVTVSYSQEIPNGDICPNFTVTDTKGNTHTLYDYCDQGKHVVIDFFAFWCGSCAYLGAPVADTFYKKYGCNTGNVILLGNECDGDITDLHGFDALTGLDTNNTYPQWPGTSGGSTIGADYGIGIFPTFVLIGPDRKMINNDMWPFTNVAGLESYFPAGILTPKDCTPTSVNEFDELKDKTLVRPVPSLGLVQIESENIQNIRVVNQVGQEMLYLEFTNQDKVSFDSKEFPTGIYYVKISTEKGEISKPFMIR